MIKRFFAITVIMIATVASVFAQGSAVKSAATQPNKPAAAITPLASGKTAVIDSRAFPRSDRRDEKAAR